MKKDILAEIKEIGLLAVLRAAGPEQALKIVDALVAGGVTGIEITFTTPEAPAVVARLKETYGEQILLGMGTLTQPEHAREAAQAGAQFLVSPHTEENLAQAMADTELPFMMGALTPSEIVRAQQLGCQVVKIFPGSMVGPSYVKSLRGPYPGLQFMPTGGVNLDNLADWFKAGAFAVGVGSALFPRQWVAEGKFDSITRRAEEFQHRVSSLLK